MCWETKKCIKPHIADKDLHVYKICLRDYNYGALPYYQSGRAFYVEGKTYDADRFDKPCPLHCDHIYEIHHGIHSYSCTCQLVQGAITSDVNLVLILPLSPKGTIAHYNTKFNIILALCSIPKGTTYYVNEDGEYVSKSIKMDKFLVLTENTIDTLNKELKKWNTE